MKNIILYIKQILVVAIISATIVSCGDDGEGVPVVSNIRVTASDSTITAGEFGLTIAIQGNNLGSVRHLYFNDVEVYLNPVYVTNSNIIVVVPDSPPSEINNLITLVTESGQTITASFEVILPDPVVEAVYNEFALPGSENKVLGKYFYVIESVMVGDIAVEITSYTDTEITFTMPETATDLDRVTVKSASGVEIVSTFRLRETEGNMINFDIPATSWGSDVCWGDSERINPENSELPVISGRYARIKQTDLAKTGYQGDWVFSTCWFDGFNLPAVSYENKVFKLEANVVEPWKGGRYKIRIGLDDGSVFIYNFQPWNTDEFRETGLTTNGWKTFVVPLSEFHQAVNDVEVEPIKRIPDLSRIRDLRVDFHNGNDEDEQISSHYVALDNLRIVDK